MSRLIAILVAAFVGLAWLPAGAQAPADKGTESKMDKKAERDAKKAERKAKREAKKAERKAKRDAKKAEKEKGEKK